MQKRFVPKETEDVDFPSPRRLGRFTKRARNVIVAARAQAAELGHDQVGNEHLLLGMLTEPEGLAAKAIVALGVSLEQARGAVSAGFEPGHKSHRRVRVGFDRGAKKTIELSLREALRLGHNYIGTEHLLLGLLRSDGDPTAKLLSGLGVTRDKTEAWVRAALATLPQAN